MTPTRVGLLVFALAVTFYWALINATERGWAAWYRLEQEGQIAVATITDIQPERHQGCSYKFNIAGIEHYGQGSGCSVYGVGGQLTVTYLPADPAFVSTGNPGEELMFEIFGPLLLAMFGGLVCAWRFRGWKRAQPA